MTMKTIFATLVALAATAAFAQHAGHAAKQEMDCCKKEAKVVAQADHCAVEAKVAKKGGDCCGDKKMSAEEEFMAEAKRMEMAANGKGECCKSTEAKPIAKGEKGCCNEVGQPAKFKVFVQGIGYTYYGCEGSAKKGAVAHSAKGRKVGSIQKVTSKATTM